MNTLIYKNGHFYKKSNGKRIKLPDNAEVEVENASTFKEEQSVGTKKQKLLNTQQLEGIMVKKQNSGKYATYQNILPKDTKLYFSITHDTIVKKQTFTERFDFEVILLEDLFVYKKVNAKKPRLYDCACQVVKNLSNNIDFYEDVYAKSLNEIYKRTYVHFFGNDGSPTCNAIDRFFEQNNNESTKIRNKITI